MPTSIPTKTRHAAAKNRKRKLHTKQNMEMCKRSCAKQSATNRFVITNRKPNRTPDTEISNLSQRQKELRIKINNTKEDSKKIELKKRNE